jgi:DNA (cytosine-5)-methyltransferase 1
MNKRNKIKFIDLFAGLGGIRIGFEQAAQEIGIPFECVFTSEIKQSAIRALEANFKHSILAGDITQVQSSDIPEFDILLAGFPCQAFSVAGKQKGFVDTRGTLFFEIERILKDKKPIGFILENVEGLVNHDKENRSDKIGKTLSVILDSLSKTYKIAYKVLDSKDFGVPQTRKRIFIVGTLKKTVSLENFAVIRKNVKSVLEKNKKTIDTDFTKKVLQHYKPFELHGKFIKDKRGGEKNIHSWDIGIRGEVSKEEKELLNLLFKERRKKHWAKEIGIDWMDGMPLTKNQIATFYTKKNLDKILDSLTEKGYLTLEHPKKRALVNTSNLNTTSIAFERIHDITKPKGYNITSGKLSFPFSHFLNPTDIAPTLVAMDMDTIGIIDGKGIRNITIREGLRLFGFPDEYDLSTFSETEIKKVYDLLGNSVCVPVVKQVAIRLLSSI